MSIENAAREIVERFCDPRVSFTEQDIAKIIRRHLFPVVKPEEVDPLKMYWVKVVNVWALVSGCVAASTQGGC